MIIIIQYVIILAACLAGNRFNERPVQKIVPNTALVAQDISCILGFGFLTKTIKEHILLEHEHVTIKSNY